jgi:hypothetical protein
MLTGNYNNSILNDETNNNYLVYDKINTNS